MPWICHRGITPCRDSCPSLDAIGEDLNFPTSAPLLGQAREIPGLPGQSAALMSCLLDRRCQERSPIWASFCRCLLRPLTDFGTRFRAVNFHACEDQGPGVPRYGDALRLIFILDFSSRGVKREKENISLSEKIKMVEMLWHVANADGKIAAVEQHTIRKIADLLNLRHNEYLKSKLNVIDKPTT